MHELVAKHVVSFLKGAGQGQHHAALETFGDTARAFADHPPDDVRLFEVGV